MSTRIETSLTSLSFATLFDVQRRRALTAFMVIAVLLQLAHVAYVLAGGADRIANCLPDDAFYYFRLGKNFAARGHWTFDGAAPATGFHLLWGYFWAAVFAAAPGIDLNGLYVLSSIVSVACYLPAAVALSVLVTECYGVAAILGVCVVFLGSGQFMLPTLGMESAPMLLCASLTCLLLLRPHPMSWMRMAALYSAGLVGMLSRSDFGVLVFACLLALVWHRVRQRNPAAGQVEPALICFAGALSGLALLLAHSWLVSGHLLQASAQTKYYWSSLRGHSIGAPMLLLAGGVVYKLPFAGTLMYPVLGIVGLGAAIAARYVTRLRLPSTPLLAAALAIAGYVVLYSRDSRALQLWYVASFASPLAIIYGACLAAVAEKSRSAAIGLLVATVAATFVLSLRPIWPHQFAMKDAGELLAAQPQLAPVGAWNAGLISYFAARQVTNLDGLVNDDILAHARSGTLAEYVRQRKLAYVIDYGAMFDPDLALRGGYADGILRACLEPELLIDPDKPAARWQDSEMTLYRVDSQCLESHTMRAR